MATEPKVCAAAAIVVGDLLSTRRLKHEADMAREAGVDPDVTIEHYVSLAENLNNIYGDCVGYRELTMAERRIGK